MALVYLIWKSEFGSARVDTDIMCRVNISTQRKSPYFWKLIAASRHRIFSYCEAQICVNDFHLLFFCESYSEADECDSKSRDTCFLVVHLDAYWVMLNCCWPLLVYTNILQSSNRQVFISFALSESLPSCCTKNIQAALPVFFNESRLECLNYITTSDFFCFAAWNIDIGGQKYEIFTLLDKEFNLLSNAHNFLLKWLFWPHDDRNKEAYSYIFLILSLSQGHHFID